MRLYLLLIFALLLFYSCRPEAQTPKPRGYYRVSLPEHQYQQFNEAGFPYSFEYPIYGVITKDTVFLGRKPENPYWIFIDFPSIGGRFYISYKTITPSQPLGLLLEDSHEMSFTVHSKRADYIKEQAFSENNVYGILYNAGGNAASAYQFIATDSTKHFLRGALYFDVTPNADSLLPANDFLKQDMIHLLETLRWK